MVDIAKCDNKNCKIKNNCYRYTSKADELWQTYIVPNKKVNKKDDCELFWENYYEV